MSEQATALGQEIMGTMQRHVNRQLLKYAAGTVMFCPGCGEVLDCRRVVNVTVLHKGEVHSSTTLCVGCYDRRKPVLDAALAKAPKEQGIELDVVDGREVFARAGKRGGK